MNSIPRQITLVRESATEVDEAASHFLAVSRTRQPFTVLHEALKGLSEALRAATKAQRQLALLLALDPDLLAGDEPLVEPLIDHE